MTVCLAGLAFGATTNGYASTQGDAGRAMLDCYKRYLKTRPVAYTKVQETPRPGGAKLRLGRLCRDTCGGQIHDAPVAIF
jgi:hypothetical protein